MQSHQSAFSVLSIGVGAQFGGLNPHTPSVPQIKTASGSSSGKHDFAFYTDGVFDDPPAIHKFQLNFKSGDHEISRIGVDPQEDGVDVLYTDKWNNKDFNWEVKSIELPPLPPSHYKKYSYTTGQSIPLPWGPCARELSWSVAVLQSFEFKVRSGDREIKKIEIRPTGNTCDGGPHLSGDLSDSSGSASLDFIVNVALVPDDAVSGGVLTTGLRRSGGGAASRYIGTRSGYRAALVGFSFEFEGGDRDLDKIRVDLSRSGYVDVSLQDVNSDDPYAYQIWYAWIRIP